MAIVTSPGDMQGVQVPDMVGNYARIMQLRNEMQNAPLQRQALQQQVQEGQIGVQQAQQGQKDQLAFRAAMQDPSMQGKSIGEVADVLAQKGAISQNAWQSAMKADTEHKQAIAKLTDTQLAAAKATHDQTQELYNNVMSAPDDQVAQNWPQIAQQFNSIPGQKQQLNPQQPLSKQQLSQFAPMISMGNAYLDQDIARRKAGTDEQTAQAALGEKQAAAKFYQQNGGAPGVPTELMQQADWMKKNPGKGPSDYKLWTMRNSPTAVVMNNQLGGQQNADALDFAAQNYRQTGQMPTGFSRSPQTTAAIIQRAAALDQQSGGQGIAVNKSTLDANRKSLDNVQKQYDTVNAFESTATKNIDMALQKAAAIPDLGARFANTPIRMINEKLLGTPEMAEFRAAMATAQTESAKVLNSANASGVLSDTARRELEDITSGNLSLKAMRGQWGVIKQDMQNRHDSYQQQISDIQGRIKGAGGSGNAPAAGANKGNDPLGIR